MEAASKFNSPVIIQVSKVGFQYFAGKSIKDQNNLAAGALALAIYIRAMAPHYGIPVILQSDHCAKKLTPWFEVILEANETYFAQYGEPLFSSHLLDLSEEPDDENIAICAQYLKRVAPMKIWMEMKIDNGGEGHRIASPEQVWRVYAALSPISPMFSVVAAFGYVYGSNNSGYVTLSHGCLTTHQQFAKSQLGASCTTDKPIYLVMHGGSGSSDEEIKAAVKAGVIKMNIDTDVQWAYWNGVRKYAANYHDYLQAQAGNPQGEDAPNKKFYDPSVWTRKGEESMVERCGSSMIKLGCNDTYPSKTPVPGTLPVLNVFLARAPYISCKGLVGPLKMLGIVSFVGLMFLYLVLYHCK